MTNDSIQATPSQPQADNLVPLRRVLVNLTSLLTNDVLNRAATFVVYAMVARYCGALSFGQLSLALSLHATWMFLVSAGLPILITREVAKDPAASGRFYINACAIVIAAAVICSAGLYLFVSLSGYPIATRKVILLLGVSVLPGALTWVTESVLKAWERMYVLVIVAVPVNALKIGVSYYLLSNGYGVLTVALVLVACFVTTFILEFLVLCRYMTWHGVSLDLGFCRALLGRAWRFFAINWLDALCSTVNTVLLSWFVGEVAVGIFSAAWQLLVPVTLALQAVHNSLFPTLCRRANSDRRQLQRLILLMLEVLAFIAVPGCVLMYFCAEPIISLIYGHRDFSGSIAIMRIVLPVVILQAVSNTFSLVLYSHHREHITLRITATNLVFNVVFGIMLVKSFGLTGAAIAAVLTALLNVSLQLWSARGLLVDGSDRKVSWGTSLLGQILAAGCTMACAMALLSRMNVIAASILTSCLYVMVLALLVTGACRRSLGIRERFLVPLKD